MVRPFFERNKVKFELPVLGQTFIMRDRSLRELLAQPYFERFRIDSLWILLDIFFIFQTCESIFLTGLYT